jgi:thymidylate synthase
MIGDTNPFRIVGSTDMSYVELIDTLIKHGRVSGPRGMITTELFGLAQEFPMNAPVIMNPFRKINYSFMAAEALWMLNGSNTVGDIVPYLQKISDFSDNGHVFFGAYGPHILRQWDYIKQKLSEDVETRQAVISIWQERPPATRDVPCTLALQFTVRLGVLHCHAFMRSSDVYLGLPYDIFNFSMISAKLAGELDLKLGNLYWHAGSAHIYTRDIEAAGVCTAYRDEFPPRIIPSEVLSDSDVLMKSLESIAMKRKDGLDWVRGE